MIAILLTLVLALMAEMLPLPHGLAFARPEFLALVLMYWSMALPDRSGLFLAWLSGLVVDVASGTLLGTHALSYLVMVGMVGLLHRRVRVMPLLQQALVILLVVALGRLMQFWIVGSTFQAPPWQTYFLPALTSMLLWPFLFTALRNYRRRLALR